MWSDQRAAAARRELTALARERLAVDDLHLTAMAVVGRVVPHDAACWGTVDPETNMVTSGTTLHMAPSPEQQVRYAELEASGEDPLPFAVLAARRAPAARSSDAPGGRQAMARWNELYRPLGIGFDLRTPLRAGGAVWGVAELFRAPGSIDFDDREVEFLASVADLLGAATRSALLTSSPAGGRAPVGPAVVVIGGDGHPSALTPAAEAWLAQAVESGPEGMGQALRSVVAAVRSGLPGARARARVDGRWVALHASPLRATDGTMDIAVAIEAASADEVSRLLLAAHGLSDRERDVCQEVLAGRSTKEIAGRLGISTHTVQDHLKAVFAKVGVNSRRELVAHLRVGGGDGGDAGLG